MRKLLCAAVFTLLLGSTFFAFGKKDTVDTSTQSLDSWLETVDISEKKPGKYNILITAEDLAGNQALSGPFNMYIDPESDLPVARITNPLEGMRVPGNLNIVGTCIDDDAVERVELFLDGSELPVVAEGKEFWSYYLDTKGLSEGEHTISVYGIDIYGVKGRPSTVRWNLDRNQPETEVKNLIMGSLVSGKFSLSGIVTDGNGIKELSFSLDQGKTFKQIPLKFNKKTFEWEFSVSINSKDIPDGPSVCWFKAQDLQGSIGVYTFLYFIDNTSPEVAFVSPGPGVAVNGRFSVAGYAQDINGLSSLRWKMGKETGEFDLVMGNPYWVKEFDIQGQKNKTVEVEISATDIAGNTVTVKKKIPVDLKADIPILEVESPREGDVVGNTLQLKGLAQDDDEIAFVMYSLDKGAPVTLESKGPFGVDISDLTTGKHTIAVWAVDMYGTQSDSILIPFVASGPLPSISLDSIETPNAEIHSEENYSLTGKVDSECGLKSLFWKITGFDEQEVKLKTGVNSIPLKIPVTPLFPYGLLSLEVRAVDIYDRESTGTLNFYVTNLSIPRDTRPEFNDATLESSAEVTIPASGKIPASTGTATVALSRVLPDDLPFENGMFINLSGPGAPKDAQKDAALRLEISSPVSINSVMWALNEEEQVRASVIKKEEGIYEALIPLKAKLTAEWKKISATVTFKDLTTQTVSGVFCVVRPSPEKGLFDFEQLVWGSANRNSSGAFILFDGATVSALYNGKPDRSAASVAFEEPVDGLSLNLNSNQITVGGTAEGEYTNVRIVVTDTEGETYVTEVFSFVVDRAVPSLSVSTTERPLWLQNELPVTVLAQDSRGVAVVEYSIDNGSFWEPFESPSSSETIDITNLPDGKVELLVRATDLVGRKTIDWRVFIKDTVSPEVQVVLPEPGDIVNGETQISFCVKDSSPIVSAEYRAPGDRTEQDVTEWIPLDISCLTSTMIGTLLKPMDEKMEFRFTDSAGNSTVMNSWLFDIDAQADLPLVEIHVPAENEILRKDFLISGVVYDDDKPAKVWYKIDEGEFTAVDIENSFSIPVVLDSLLDNEHFITMYAEDIHGVKGDEVVRNFRVSLEEPKASVTSPSFETTNSKIVEITGVASDKNGIEKVEVSLDNGNTFYLALGAEDWTYRFDTRVIQDGTHVVFIRVYDKYETTGLYSSLINIDNTAPSIKLELPLDGSRSNDVLFIAGQSIDNIALDKVSAKISNLSVKQPAVPESLEDIPFENELIISRGIDISVLPEGFYNVEVRGFDRAGNITRVSRNFEVYRNVDRNRIEFLYPLNGEPVQGLFNVYGKVVSEDPINNLILYVDDVDVGVTELTQSGYFKFMVSPEMITDGTHNLSIRALVSNDSIIRSEDHAILYKADGPWVTIDNFAMGDFAINRPWLMGTTGYSFTEEEIIALKAKETSKEERKRLRDKSLETVEISFDNGKTFVPTESGKKWRYRIETGDLAEGYHFLIVRSTMRNGEIAVSRSIIQIDKTKPTIKLISPGEGGRYNNELVFSGLSADDVELDSVLLSLRPGDKSAYAVPSFIQGLYFDWHFWGATVYDVGVGLTFFDDNVKLQAQFGQFTAEQRSFFSSEEMRYGGNVFGVKLLANIARVPLEFFFGPDFSWLSASAAVGANFSQFSKTQSGKPQILSGVLGQFEFPIVTIPKRKTFRTFSFYSEAQLWFIPTDVSSSDVNINSIVPHISGGVRLNVF